MTKFDMELGPFIPNKLTTKKHMRTLLIALIPIIIFAIYKHGYIPYSNNEISFNEIFYPLIFILSGAFTGVLIELIYARIVMKKNKTRIIERVEKSYSYMPGLILALILPANTPIYILIIGTFFGVVFGKLLYGGFGKNIFNPALLGFMLITFLSKLNIIQIYKDGVIIPPFSPSNLDGIGSYSEIVKPFGDLYDFLFGNIPGALGVTNSALIILAFMYLSSKKVIKWEIPLIYVGTVFIMNYIIATIVGIGLWYPVMQILSGGLLFGAVFMATDPVTSPVTPIGKIFFGVALGILTVIFRHTLSHPESIMLSILFLNAAVSLFDKLGSVARFNFDRVAAIYAFAIILMITTSIFIAKMYTSDLEKVANLRQGNTITVSNLT